MTRNNDFDILRGYAVLATFMAHADEFFAVPKWIAPLFTLPWGFGVDIFFVLSGFLITRSLLQLSDTASARNVLRIFWIKRAFRILPPSLVWLAVAVAGAILYLPPEPSGIHGILRSGLASLLNVQNFWFSYCVETGQVTTYCGGLKTLAVWWSLSLEEQFYLVFPIILLAARPRMTFVIALIVALAYAYTHKTFLNLALVTRLEGLCYGVMLAIAYDGIPWTKFAVIPRSLIRLVAHMALIGIFAVNPVFAQVLSSEFCFGISMFLCFTVVFAASADAQVFTIGKLTTPAWWIGTTSFSFYLCHEVVLAATAHFIKIGLFDGSGSVKFAVYCSVAFAFILLFSWLSRDLIERPSVRCGQLLLSSKSYLTRHRERQDLRATNLSYVESTHECPYVPMPRSQSKDSH